jgi:hypothetical protein
MKNLFLTFVVFTVSFSAFGYTQEQKEEFLYFMKRACGGENECYYRAESGLDGGKEGNGIVYFSCHAKFAGLARQTLGHEKFGKCLSKGAKGYEKLLRKNGFTKLANKYVKRIADCESWGGMDSQFTCYQNYLRYKKGKYK